ncbi:hypothetical protein Sked_25890 [Sanguibacter keddieii DSM 10542]|uniref:Putative zinc-finger domain-containing protein n=1 Tax=Sanguibacter keddieii (strain ATCC 51767 / DSM 10542 / NCFB 3025 / ST-74) TaxID=446469 RepID=D1BKL6_SANKS|nr:zf-HC2 domain-containing protein [Sanguibacter keddieii]ACZ22493.1 hypothetical protein Sked_25890 [Sanguibacter keddieii DSM 10542]
MSAHLGDWVSALVDNQLAPADRERCLAHLAACPVCAREVEDARAARRALVLDIDEVRPAPDFMSRLLSMSEPPAPAAGEVVGFDEPGRGEGGGPRAASASPLVPHEQLPPRWRALCGDVDHRGGRRGRAVIAAILGTTMVTVSLFTLGDRPMVAPDRQQTEALSALAAAAQLRSSDGLVLASGDGATVSGPGTDGYDHEVLEWMSEQGWPRPDPLPDTVTVSAVRYSGTHDDVLEVDLDTPFGDVVLREQHGRLDPDKVSDLRTVDAGGAPVYVVSDAPVHLVWQSSDTVVDLVAPGSLDDVLQLVSTFPVDEYDPGFQARVGRGWTTLTGVLS